MFEIFVTAKQGVYPKGDTFRGILELQLGAVVLELMVFGEQKKGNGSAGAVFYAKAPRKRVRNPTLPCKSTEEERTQSHISMQKYR